MIERDECFTVPGEGWVLLGRIFTGLLGWQRQGTLKCVILQVCVNFLGKFQFLSVLFMLGPGTKATVGDKANSAPGKEESCSGHAWRQSTELYMWFQRLTEAKGAKLRHHSTPGESEALTYEGLAFSWSTSASPHSLYPTSNLCLLLPTPPTHLFHLFKDLSSSGPFPIPPCV